MAFARGIYGIEYDPVQRHGPPAPVRWAAAAILVATAVSFAAVKIRGSGTGSGETSGETRQEEKTQSRSVPAPQPPPPPPPPVAPISVDTPEKRPPKVRNLLMRLAEAEKAGDLELAVSTIEQLRAQPGKPAADIDDSLARRLGDLNFEWLFTRRSPLWTKQVVVKPGDSATRIARENGSTLASLARLNPSVDVERIRSGMKLCVMNHPRFNLIAVLSSRTADLHVNGKFFKRYDLADGLSAASGAYETGANFRKSAAEAGIRFKRPEDAAELEMMLPKGTSLLITEM